MSGLRLDVDKRKQRRKEQQSYRGDSGTLQVT
jgi:hypothetical protein